MNKNCQIIQGIFPQGSAFFPTVFTPARFGGGPIAGSPAMNTFDNRRML
jgi:hypothetical protein